ncbi:MULTISPECIES: glycosyltransferase family 2 protein [unclassified Blastococcus]
MSRRERGVWWASIAMGVLGLALFAQFWFDPARIDDASPHAPRWAVVTLFVLLTFVVWHRIVMDALGHVVSRRLPQYAPPPLPEPGLRVAFITTFVPGSEPLAMLARTLEAMLAAEYPHDTWVLDEGDDPDARELCRQLGVRHFSRKGVDRWNQPEGRFAARTKGGNHNAWYEAHGNGYEVVAQIDTDFVARPDFLTATLGYFRDRRTGWVVTPQVYGNTGTLVARGAAQQQYTFYGPFLQGMSARGMAMMLGANHVVRVAALRSVDWYEGHITEDLATGIKLHAAGWRSHYVPRALAVGEGPSTWLSYFNQQARWAYGCFALLFQVTPRQLRKLGPGRGSLYLWLQQNYFSGLAFVLGASLIAFYFATGIAPASIPLVPLLACYAPYLVWRQAHTFWMQRFNVTPEQEGGWHWPGRLVGTVVQPVYALALAYVLVGRRLVFKVTPKGAGAERLTPLAVFRQHLVLAVLMATATVCGGILGHTGWPMVAWAVVIVVAMVAVPVAELPRRVAVAMAGRRPVLRTAGRHRVRFEGNRAAVAGGPVTAAGQVPLNHVAVPVQRAAEGGVAVPSTLGQQVQSGS